MRRVKTSDIPEAIDMIMIICLGGPTDPIQVPNKLWQRYPNSCEALPNKPLVQNAESPRPISKSPRQTFKNLQADMRNTPARSLTGDRSTPRAPDRYPKSPGWTPGLHHNNIVCSSPFWLRLSCALFEGCRSDPRSSHIHQP